MIAMKMEAKRALNRLSEIWAKVKLGKIFGKIGENFAENHILGQVIKSKKNCQKIF